MIPERTQSGQDEAWREWRLALGSQRMHHAWLLAGAKGLGKQVFAREAALSLLDGNKGPQPEFDSHPDIHVLEPLPSTDDEAKKKAEGKPYQTKRNISVDQIREMIRKLSTKPTLGERRAIIVEPADAMETGAVNALLKVLEEPPAGTFFLLLAHQPGRLLPTVRSRCRMLRFAPFSHEKLDAMLLREAPEADAETRAAAIEAAQGSPGLARSFVEQDLGVIHTIMMRILREGDATFALRGALVDALGSRPARERQLAVLELARAVLFAQLQASGRDRQLKIIEAHKALTGLLVQAPTYNFDAGLLIMDIGGLLATAAMPRERAR